MTPTIHLPQPVTNPATALAEAKFLLETDGWIVGNWKCETGKRCAAGAVRAACGHYERPESYSLDEAYSDPAYVESITALAAAIKPTWYLRDYDSRDDYLRATTPASRAVYAEDFVADYNDARIETASGRNAVLRRFDKAISSLSS